MTQPQPYQINNDGYGQAIYAVNEFGPGVVHGLHVNEFGEQAFLVGEPGSGAVPVFFENGPPPGSAEWIAQQMLIQQQQYAAVAGAATARLAAEQADAHAAHQRNSAAASLLLILP